MHMRSRPRYLVTVVAFMSLVAWSATALAADGAELLAEGDALMEKLGEGDPRGAIAKYEEAAKAGASTYDTQWRIARAYFWWSDWQDNLDKKKELGLKGMAAGEKAMEANPDGVEGCYFYAINVGEYSKGISIVKALGQGMEGKFRGAAEKAVKLDSTFDNGGPRNAMGRFYYELPWPKKKLKKSQEILEKNIKEHPGNFRARYYLAETLLAEKEQDAAKKQLEYMVNNEPASHNEADGLRYQRMAKKLLGELE